MTPIKEVVEEVAAEIEAKVKAQPKWIEITVAKDKVVRKEEKYIVVKIDGTHSTVLPTRMIRKIVAEAPTFKFPNTFKFKVQERKQNADSKMYEVVSEVEIDAAELKARLG